MEKKIDIPEMMSVKDIIDNLGLGRNTVYNLIKRKDFPKLQIGRSYVIPKDKYIEWLNKNIGKTINI